MVKKIEVPRRTRMGRLPSNDARACERAHVGRCMQSEELSGITTGLRQDSQRGGRQGTGPDAGGVWAEEAFRLPWRIEEWPPMRSAARCMRCMGQERGPFLAAP